MKPRIFVSTVTSEFRTARTKIEHVLEFLGYEVVQQDIFGAFIEAKLRGKVRVKGGSDED